MQHPAGRAAAWVRGRLRCHDGEVILRAAALTVSSSILLARCSLIPGLGQPAAPTPTPRPPIPLQVSYSAISGGFMGLWITKASGIFSQYGLEVTPQLIPGGNNSLAALLSGQVQITESGGSDALAADINGGDVVVLGVTIPVYPYLLMVSPDIKSPADLKGKRLAAGATGSSGDVALRVALRQLGLNPERDMTIISVQSRQTGATALLNGALQGVVDDPPDSVVLEGQGFHPLFSMVDLRLPAAQAAIMAQRTWVADHRDVVQAYVDARVAGMAWTRENRQFAIDVLKQYFKSDDDHAMGVTYDYYLNILPVLPHARPGLFADAINELARTNEDVRTFDVSTILNDSFVRSAESRGIASRD
jgi:NitT/TauT family transport system substrate-binding protein